MLFHKKNHSKESGFTLIETIVGSVIFVVVALAAYQAFSALMASIDISQAKLAGTALANEKLEIMRNLPYTDVGIINGIPSGKIQRTETATRDNFIFNITTTIRNEDDPFDGTMGGTPADTSPADYKLVDLDITCSNCKTLAPLNFTTIITPHALETASSNGALFVRVINASGLGVQGASIHILNAQPNPDIVIDDTTDDTGWLKIIDAPPGTKAYNVIATKNGFSQDQTYPVGGAAGSSPVIADSTVVIQKVTQVTLSIDQLASLNVSTIDSSCVAFPNIGFSLTGTKLIGTPSVLKYPTQNFTTNSSATYTIPTIEWDTYSALLTSASYDLAGVNPSQSFAISPAENKNIQLVAVPHVNRALLVSVKTYAGAPIDGATVRLQKGGFDQTITTNPGPCATPGQVFWNGLGSGTYTLTVTKTGYQTNTSSISVSSNWQNKNIVLTP